ncbi:hypothetical protein JAAARDRAFT_83648, partial [Jaapia argillacea MUCL 33604]
GHSMMIDGIAVNQRAWWLRVFNEILGLCRDHTPGLDLGMTDMPSVLHVVEAVHGESPTCHYGREATVAAIGPYRPDNYHPMPVMVSLTCKSETAEQFAVVMQLLIDQYKIHSAPLNGPLFTIGLDGDGVFWGACHIVLMKQVIEPLSKLGVKISGLNGLNKQTGDDDITMDPDPKHLVKRTL